MKDINKKKITAFLIILAIILVLFYIVYYFKFVGSRAGTGSVVLDSQADWQAGSYNANIDLTSSPGDITLDFNNPSWTKATAAAGWSARYGHTAVVYDNKMWVMGGHYGAVSKNDVWYSTDGVTWTQATAAAGWSARTWHESIVFDNKMWVMGGYYGGVPKNDVWYSTDGVTWTQATAAAGWAARFDLKSVVFDNRMWVMGGGIVGNVKNDVWYSTDGVTWTQATAAAGWLARIGHTAVVYDNRMWVMGGWDNISSYYNDVWYSTDGVSWIQATASAWPRRTFHTSLVFDNKIWVMGGYYAGLKNDVWYSTDGGTWTQATAAAGWLARQRHASVVYDNKMWVIGGAEPFPITDVWYSTWLGVHTSAATQIDAGESLTGWITFVPQATIPAGASISFRFRTSANGSTWTSWSSSTPYAASIDISGQSGSNRYFQVETTLSDTDNLNTPVLSSYTINFNTGDTPTPTPSTSTPTPTPPTPTPSTPTPTPTTPTTSTPTPSVPTSTPTAPTPITSTLLPSETPEPPPDEPPTLIEKIKTVNPFVYLFILIIPYLISLLNPISTTSTFLYRLWFNFLEWSGIRKKRKPWGIIYDYLTKKSLPLAMVKIIDKRENRVKQTYVTDKYGAYYFTPQAGFYTLKVFKSNYRFPVEEIKKNNDKRWVKGESDGQYQDIYTGGFFSIDQDEKIVNCNIPLEHTGAPTFFSKAVRYLDLIVKFVYRIRIPLLTLGSLISILALFLFGTLFDILTFVFYALAWILELLRMIVPVKSSGSVLDDDTSKPLEQAIVRLMEIKGGKENLLEAKVTNKKGRYDFLVLPGDYRLSVNRAGYKSCKLKTFKVKSQRFLDFDIKLKINTSSLDK